MELSEYDRLALEQAVRNLECSSFAMQVANTVGMPVERILTWLPEGTRVTIQRATERAIGKSLEMALRTLDSAKGGAPADRRHRALSAASGAAGGFFGIGGLVLELPVSTTLMLRSIADIARCEGEDLDDRDAQLSCIEVFALGSGSEKSSAVESGYYAIRTTLATTLREAAKYIAERGLAETGAPPLVRLIAQIAARFGIVVSEKAAAQMVPVLGAAGGAAINILFLSHFQRIAHGHFTVRRLERTYGADGVRQEYERLRAALDCK